MKRIISICIAAVMLAGTTAFAAQESDVTEIAMGTSKADVYAKIGAPQKGSVNGSKETYTLSNGKTAVLHYYDDILHDGFIIIN